MKDDIRRFGRVLKLKPEFEKEYIEYHTKVWPEVLKAMRECGIVNYSIFLHNGYLFAYMEMHKNKSLDTLVKEWVTYDVCVEWESVMNKMQEKAQGAKEDEWWSEMKEIFHYHVEGTDE